MNVFISEAKTTVAEADPGLLLLLDGTLIMKTEYSSEIDGSAECFIVKSGEAYAGEGKTRVVCRQVIVE